MESLTKDSAWDLLLDVLNNNIELAQKGFDAAAEVLANPLSTADLRERNERLLIQTAAYLDFAKFVMTLPKTLREEGEKAVEQLKFEFGGD